MTRRLVRAPAFGYVAGEAVFLLGIPFLFEHFEVLPINDCLCLLCFALGVLSVDFSAWLAGLLKEKGGFRHGRYGTDVGI